MKIELTTSPSPDDAKFISQGLIRFNNKHIPELESEEAVKFSIFARDASNRIIGGLRATCFWNTLHIELLWVLEKRRGDGIGFRLMERAEVYALKQGYEISLLESTSWQARSFYEKLNYKVMASLPEYPRGHATHFLVKQLV